MRKVKSGVSRELYLWALRDDVEAIGGALTVGRALWPRKSATAARNAVNDRLNPARRERFSSEHERYIMRSARKMRGFSDALNFICDETGFERPPAKKPEVK